MIYRPRLTLGAGITLASTVLCLLLPGALAVAAPGLTRPGSQAPTPKHEARAAAGSARVESALDELPLVVRDLPDAPSRDAVATYDAAHLHDTPALATMFVQAWSGLVAAPGGAPPVASLGDYLLFAGPSADPFSDLGDLRAGPVFDGLAQPAITALAPDARNADRLSNAAVALFDLGVSEDHSGPGSVAGRPIAPASSLRLHAVRLLRAAAPVFPDDRAVWLDGAYLTSVASQGSCAENHLAAASGSAARWLQAHPADLTARLLAASLTARATVKPAEVQTTLQTLQPALAAPATAAIAHAVRADDFLALADRLAPTAPFLAARYAGDALADYDRALSQAPDPGLHAGRAAALDDLGRAADAVAEQRRAVALAPGSIDLLLGLAGLQEEVGDFAGMRASARTAMQLATANPDPPLRGSRLVAAPDPGQDGEVIVGDRGMLGWSFGGDLPGIGVFSLRSPRCSGGGGGYVVAQDIIPAVPDAPPEAMILSSFPQDRALLSAVSASMLLGDARAGVQDLLDLQQAEAADPRLAGDPGRSSTRTAAHEALAGALLMATGSSGQYRANPNRALGLAQFMLRHGAAAVRPASVPLAARLSGRTTDMCRQLLAAPSTARPNVVLALVCDAEASYGRGDFRRAVARLRDADGATQRQSTYDPAIPTQDHVDLELAIALRSAGDQSAARTLFEHVAGRLASSTDGEAAPLEQLGTLALDEGQPQAAVPYLDLALESVHLAGLALKDRDALVRDDGIERIVQRVYNNRGIALLRSVQKQPDVPPDCGRNRALCQEAGDDFRAALEFDPANPDYLLNLGWAARLLGDRREAVDALRAAGSGGPIAFSALNDLGVLAARTGDERTARRALESALTLAPDDDLPAWNLGILHLHDWPAGVPAGEAYLARAIRRNPRLATAPLDYRTDERVYRHTFLADPAQPAGQGAGQNLTTATLQAATVVSAFGAAGAAGIGDTLAKAVEALRDRALEFIGHLQRRLRRRLRRVGTVRLRRLARTGHPWVLTGLAVAAVAAASAWSSAAVSRPSALTIGLFAVLAAALVHESAHMLAVSRTGFWVRPVFWAPGVVLALVLLPFRLSTGPYVGHRVQMTAPVERSWWISLAGPAANLVVGAAAYLLYRLDPLPVLRLMAQAQLFTLGFTILPFRPLDGSVLVKRHPWVVGGLGLVVGVGATALGLGKL
jgi:tetratricopeptide (TPR) repeat protein